MEAKDIALEIIRSGGTIKEAAKFLSISETSLRRWIKAGEIKCYKLGNKGIIRFKQKDLDEYLNNNIIGEN